MSYELAWELVGNRALSDAERKRIAKHVAKWNKDIEGYDLFVAKATQEHVQAFYSVHPTNEELEDELTLERVFDALGELRKLLSAFELRVAEGFFRLEWDGDGFIPTSQPGGLFQPDANDEQWDRASRWSRSTKADMPKSDTPKSVDPSDLFADVAPKEPDAATIEAFLDAAQLHRYPGRLERGVMLEALRRPQWMSRVVEAWLRACEMPAGPDIAATFFFAPLASEPAMFYAAVAILRAVPVDIEGHSDARAMAAFAMLSRATSCIDDATAVLIACLRRDGNTLWREHIIGALADCDTEAARAALLLDLEAGAHIRWPYARAFARTPDAASWFRRIRDLPFAIRHAFDEWWRIESPDNDVHRRALLDHPYWYVRWSAARAAPHGVRDGDSEAVWRTLEGAETSLDASAADEFQYGLEETRRELPPLPPATAGLTSTCTDYRRWALQYVDARQRVSDAPVLILADELDEALAIRGYPRMRPRWSLWRRVVPDLPLEPGRRARWARERDIDDEALREVARLGAAVVAERFPPPRLVLTPREHERAQRLVRAAEERGRRLLRLL